MRRQVVHFEITKLERYFKIHFVQQNPWLYTHFSTLSVSLHHLHFLTLCYRFQKTQIACWSWIAFIWGKRASEHKHISWLKFLAQPQVHEPTQRTVPILWAVLRLHWFLKTTRGHQTPQYSAHKAVLPGRVLARAGWGGWSPWVAWHGEECATELCHFALRTGLPRPSLAKKWKD